MPFKDGSGNSLSNDLKQKMERFNTFRLVKLPDYLIHLLQKMVDDAFRAEKYPGKSQKWDERKNENRESREEDRALLVHTGDLVRSLEVEKQGQDIIIGTDKVYAQIHNEGLYGLAFGKYPFKMSQRQYMPIPGEPLPEATQAEMDKHIDGQMDEICN